MAGVAFSGFFVVLNWSLHLLADGSDGRTAADVPGAQGGELFATLIRADAAGRLGRMEKSHWCNCSPVQAAFANAS